jgi:hypothetical protein
MCYEMSIAAEQEGVTVVPGFVGGHKGVDAINFAPGLWHVRAGS